MGGEGLSREREVMEGGREEGREGEMDGRGRERGREEWKERGNGENKRRMDEKR